MIRKRWAVAALAAAIGLVMGAASMVVAGAVVVTGQANDLAVIKTVASDVGPSTTSDSYQDVAGAVRRATSTGAGNLFVAHFSAEVGTCIAVCQVRIIVKDLSGSLVAIMNPPGGNHDFADSSEATYAVERSITSGTGGMPAAGTFDFQVQFRSTNSGDVFNIDSWHLILERYT